MLFYMLHWEWIYQKAEVNLALDQVLFMDEKPKIVQCLTYNEDSIF